MADNLRKMIIDYFEYCDRNELENKKAAEIWKNIIKPEKTEGQQN